MPPTVMLQSASLPHSWHRILVACEIADWNNIGVWITAYPFKCPCKFVHFPSGLETALFPIKWIATIASVISVKNLVMGESFRRFENFPLGLKLLPSLSRSDLFNRVHYQVWLLPSFAVGDWQHCGVRFRVRGSIPYVAQRPFHHQLRQRRVPHIEGCWHTDWWQWFLIRGWVSYAGQCERPLTWQAG